MEGFLHNRSPKSPISVVELHSKSLNCISFHTRFVNPSRKQFYNSGLSKQQDPVVKQPPQHSRSRIIPTSIGAFVNLNPCESAVSWKDYSRKPAFDDYYLLTSF